MNYKLPFIPERTKKPRNTGLAMVMDKGLSIQEAENLCEVAGDYVDFVKFGFGTSLVSKNIKEKIKIFRSCGIRPYFGGTLFEIFLIRNMFDEYKRFVDEHQLDVVEVSDGSMVLNHEQKCEYIRQLSQYYTVLSEVGSKEESIIISPSRWIKMMKNELQAGAFKVIAEARESGNVGIYRSNGSAHVVLINKILSAVNVDDVIWEAPNKSQQVWFVKLLGCNVNLGNIAPQEIISLETIRLGLRGDTFYQYLPEELQIED
ncbi:MAG: phosphosulfolactate synthase [Bacteroidales bacterium]|nr:phosphosulfolactate synthase [Bacteroidales bacterium]